MKNYSSTKNCITKYTTKREKEIKERNLNLKFNKW